MIFQKKYSRVIGVILAVAVSLIVFAFGTWEYKQAENMRRRDARIMLQTYKKNIMLQLQEKLNYAYDLNVGMEPDSINIDRFEKHAEKLLKENEDIVYLSMIKGDKVKSALPKQSFGGDVGKDISQFSYVYTLTKVKGELVVEGPVELKGTDEKVFLFLQPLKKGNTYIGQTAAALKADYVMDQLALSYLEKHGYEYQLWHVNPQSGDKEVTASSDKNIDFSDSEQTTFYLPTQWNLCIIPKGSWVENHSVKIIFGGCTAFVIILLAILCCAWKISSQGRRLRDSSFMDFPTGLYNRLGLENEIDRWLSRGAEHISLFYFVIEDYNHIAPAAGYKQEKEYLESIAGIFDEYIQSPHISGSIGSGRLAVAVREKMTKYQMEDLARGLALELLWKVRLNGKKIFLKAEYQYASYPGDGEDASALLDKVFKDYYERLEQESPVRTLTEKCRRLADGETNVVFDEYSNVDMMQLSMAINQYRRQVEQLAYCDPAFNVGNRIKYMRDARMLIAYDKKRYFSLYCIDICSFGKYNELFNEQTGDEVLKKVITLLQPLFGEYLYRINGDVFLGLTFSREEPESMISKILKTLEEPVRAGASKFTLRVKIGVCAYPQHANTPEGLLEQVQVALRYAKRQNGNSVVYNGALTGLLKKENDLLFLLEQSLREETLEVWYQPLFNRHTGTFTCAEALVRLKNQEGKYVSADQVISTAEQHGIADRLGGYVLRKACKFMKEQGCALGLTKLSVNLSVQQFLVEDSADIILSAITESGVNPAYMSLEITETILIQSMDRMVGILSYLREKGIHIALDDFGVGYSSFNYLSRLPVDVLKIDKSLTCCVADSPKQRTLFKAIVDMARINDILVVAEGVEKEEELNVVNSVEVDYIQGYYYAKPMPADQLCEMLRKIEKKYSPIPNPIL